MWSVESGFKIDDLLFLCLIQDSEKIPLNGNGNFFPVWWCNRGSIVQSVWPAGCYHFISEIVHVITGKYGIKMRPP